MNTKMCDEGEETFTYEPRSFIEERPNVNPDSPRHFKNKRRRNNANSKLKGRPKSLIDFRGMNPKKEQTTDRFAIKRSKTFIERCRGAIQRSNSMDSIFDNSACEKDMNRNPLNYSKPITSRLKVREIRKTDIERLDDKSAIIRSKSDVGIYFPSLTDLDEIASHSTLLKIHRGCDYATDDSRFTYKGNRYFDRDNSDSLDSFKTKSNSSTTSSPNSSGFCDYTGTESEFDTLSSDGSSIITGEILFRAKKSSSMDISLDMDKNAEEKLYSESLKKNRRPLSIYGKTTTVRSRGERFENVKSAPGSLCPSGVDDDVFSIDDIVDCKCVDSGIENTLSTNTNTMQSPRRNAKSAENKKKYKQNRKTRPKSMINITSVSHVNERIVRNYGRNIRIESVL